MRFKLWGRAQRNRGLEEEIQAHLALAEREEMESGRQQKEAREAARREFGNVGLAEETTRDMWAGRWLADFIQDAGYALRTMRKQPGFVAAVLLTLALGIGATTVMFTVVNGVLLRPLPYFDPHRLVEVHGHSDSWNTAAFGEQHVAYPDFLDVQRESKTVELAGEMYNGGTVSSPGDPAHIDLREISANLFSVLGVSLAQGRAFRREEDHLGAAPVAILGNSFWKSQFAGNPKALGEPLVLDGKSYTVVGIARPGFRLDGDEPDVFTPIGQDTARFLRTRGPHPVGVLGRLRSGAKVEQVQAELALIGRQLSGQYPDTNQDRTFVVEELRPEVGNVGPTLWLLLGSVGLVLLIACVNVVSLVLARAISREREVALRVALGAGRGRLVRQCLTENALLGVCGGMLGILAAANGVRPFLRFWPGGLPRAEEVQIDWRVLVFTLLISLLSGLLFGLVPALRAPTRDVEKILRAGARTIVRISRGLHSSFVICEIAVAVVLLVSAGILGRTLIRLSSLDPGVNIRNVLTMRMALSPATLPSPGQIRAAWQDVLERARHVPGVESVTILDTVPMREGHNQIGYWAGADVPPENKTPLTLASSVSPDYLKVMGIALREGRFIDEHDRMGSELVVVIDDVLAHDAFGYEDPIGKNLWFPGRDSPFSVQAPGKDVPDRARVVGVVAHVRYWGLASDDQAKVRAQLYYSFAQVPDQLLHRWSDLMSIAVRTKIPPLNVVGALRRELKGAGGDQVLYEVNTLEQLSRGTIARQRFLVLLFGVFAGLALLLACVGLYGVMAYLTGKRVPEFGVRMAFGASARDVMRLVLGQSLGMIFAGVGVGLLGAMAASSVLAHLVDGMRPAEPLAFAIMIPVLIAAALMASFLPAWRASRVDPLIALKYE